jgi:hypothetical protein
MIEMPGCKLKFILDRMYWLACVSRADQPASSGHVSNESLHCRIRHSLSGTVIVTSMERAGKPAQEFEICRCSESNREAVKG